MAESEGVRTSGSPPLTARVWLKPCPHCRRKVRLSQKTSRQRRNSATVALSATVWTEL